jgi:hypothetical protein
VSDDIDGSDLVDARMSWIGFLLLSVSIKVRHRLHPEPLRDCSSCQIFRLDVTLSDEYRGSVYLSVSLTPR